MGRRRLVAALIAVTAALAAAVVVAAAQHRNGTASAGADALSFAEPWMTSAAAVTTDPAADPAGASAAGPAGTAQTTATDLASVTPSTPLASSLSSLSSRPAGSSPASAPTARPSSAATRTPKADRPTAKPKTKAKPKAAPSTPPAAAGSGSGQGAGRIQYGHTYTGRGTFYAATGAGNCSYEATGDLMVGAMNQQDYDNSQACGAYLAVTGPNGTTITIKVVDRCPECPPGAIDLSREAFTKLAPTVTGQIALRWKLLSPALTGPVSYKYKSGSSKYWCGIQVRNHRNPVRSLALKVGSSWRDIPRLNYNYFVSADGAGCGSPIRITDIYGHQLVDSGIEITPDAVQRGQAQFGAPS